MNMQLQKTLTSVLAALFCFLPKVYAQQANSLQQEAVLLRNVLEKNHYSPRTLDNQFSKDVFSQFLTLLDPHCLYFTEADLKELSAYNLQIDDEIKGNSWKFLPLATQIYKKRLLSAEKTCADLLQKPFDFSKNEAISFSEKNSLYFAVSDKDYLERWHKWLKYLTLQQLANIHTESSQGGVDKMSNFLFKEATIRQKVQQTEKRKIKRILEHPSGFENYIGSLFFYTITTCFDPHSTYLSKTDRENFESHLSKEPFTFGIDLDENATGDITIARLIPGGPAWKSNQLHKGDVLTELKWKGKNAVDLAGADIEEVQAILDASNTGWLEITTRKASGMTKTVSLMKEKMREDANIVKSFILKGEKKIGYISLPGFYTEWENMTGQGCANDVAKEIIKLKEENIDGLILDIRHNGGGSLGEGLNLAGIFINEGPLCLMQGKDGKITTMKDMNRGTIYDGPLVLMVNGQSASASEVLASTLQDYNRALIVGNQTFGKATGQLILPLDPNLSNPAAQYNNFKSPWGFSTVTIHKLYRVNGKSAQLKGVQPDIYQPDIYESFAYRESIYPFALSNDSLNKKVYFSPLKALPVQELNQRSNARIQANPSFQIIQKLMESWHNSFIKESRGIILQPSYFNNLALEKYSLWQAFEKAMEQQTNVFTVENTGYDKEVMRIDAYSKEVNDLLIKQIQNSIYITETYQIINDLISLEQSNSK